MWQRLGHPGHHSIISPGCYINPGPLSTNYSSIVLPAIVQSTISSVLQTMCARDFKLNVGTGVFDLAFLRSHIWRRSLSEVVLRSVMPSFCSLDPVQRCSDFAVSLSWSSTGAAALPNSFWVRCPCCQVSQTEDLVRTQKGYNSHMCYRTAVKVWSGQLLPFALPGDVLRP